MRVGRAADALALFDIVRVRRIEVLDLVRGGHLVGIGLPLDQLCESGSTQETPVARSPPGTSTVPNWPGVTASSRHRLSGGGIDQRPVGRIAQDAARVRRHPAHPDVVLRSTRSLARGHLIRRHTHQVGWRAFRRPRLRRRRSRRRHRRRGRGRPCRCRGRPCHRQGGSRYRGRPCHRPGRLCRRPGHPCRRQDRLCRRPGHPCRFRARIRIRRRCPGRLCRRRGTKVQHRSRPNRG